MCDTAGEQFRNIRGESIFLITPYSHIEGQGEGTNPKTSWMFMQKDLDDAFDALTASPKYVSLKRTIVEPVTDGKGPLYFVKDEMEPVVCNVCSDVSR